MIKVGDVVLIEAEVVKVPSERDYYMVLVRGVKHAIPVARVAIRMAEPSKFRDREIDLEGGRGPFAANLRRIRQGRNMTQRELAEKVGVVYGAVGNWEYGRCFPRLATLKKICTALDVTIDQLTSKESL